MMPFNLKNGATYQRVMNAILIRKSTKTMEVYINNVVIKVESYDENLRN